MSGFGDLADGGSTRGAVENTGFEDGLMEVLIKSHLYLLSLRYP